MAAYDVETRGLTEIYADTKPKNWKNSTLRKGLKLDVRSYEDLTVRIERELGQRLLLGKKLDNTAAKHEAQAVVDVVVNDQLAGRLNNIPNTWLDSAVMAIIRKVNNNAARTMRGRGGAQSRAVPFQPPPQPATFQQPFQPDPQQQHNPYHPYQPSPYHQYPHIPFPPPPPYHQYPQMSLPQPPYPPYYQVPPPSSAQEAEDVVQSVESPEDQSERRPLTYRPSPHASRPRPNVAAAIPFCQTTIHVSMEGNSSKAMFPPGDLVEGNERRPPAEELNIFQLSYNTFMSYLKEDFDFDPKVHDVVPAEGHPTITNARTWRAQLTAMYDTLKEGARILHFTIKRKSQTTRDTRGQIEHHNRSKRPNDAPPDTELLPPAKKPHISQEASPGPHPNVEQEPHTIVEQESDAWPNVEDFSDSEDLGSAKSTEMELSDIEDNGNQNIEQALAQEILPDPPAAPLEEARCTANDATEHGKLTERSPHPDSNSGTEARQQEPPPEVIDIDSMTSEEVPRPNKPVESQQVTEAVAKRAIGDASHPEERTEGVPGEIPDKPKGTDIGNPKDIEIGEIVENLNSGVNDGEVFGEIEDNDQEQLAPGSAGTQ
ncbi:MAG: hypothetical protein M1837_001838 [Sclerophora amabilis]|nr:MAG: hypothetical protein M1837_001838 [Sclerophora amabilis]